MPWKFELDRYLLECRLSEQPPGTTTLTVLENGQQVHEETLQIRPGEDALDFRNRVWPRVWELQNEYRGRAQVGMQREWERQARER